MYVVISLYRSTHMENKFVAVGNTKLRNEMELYTAYHKVFVNKTF